MWGIRIVLRDIYHFVMGRPEDSLDDMANHFIKIRTISNYIISACIIFCIGAIFYKRIKNPIFIVGYSNNTSNTLVLNDIAIPSDESRMISFN